MNKTKSKSTKAKAQPPVELAPMRDNRLACECKIEPLPMKNTNLKLPPAAVRAMERLKVVHGYTNTFAITRGLVMLEQSLNYSVEPWRTAAKGGAQ